MAASIFSCSDILPKTHPRSNEPHGLNSPSAIKPPWQHMPPYSVTAQLERA